MFRIPHFLKIVLAAIIMCAMTTAGTGMASAAPVTAATPLVPSMTAASVTQARSAALAAASAGVASAVLPMVSGECKNGRCVVKLSHKETKAMGDNKLFVVPAWVPVLLRAALIASARVHAWIAKQYAKKGLCSQFVLDIRPWASQGYMSRKC